MGVKMILTDNIFSYTFRTSMGIYNRFLIKDGKTVKCYPYLPYEKISDNEFIVKPDLSKELVLTALKINLKELKLYDKNRKYINVFQNTSKENNIMNYDEYGFPIFDDEYEDEIKTLKTESKITENVKEIKKEEPKKDKNALF